MKKGLKLKVRKFREVIPTFVEVTGEKLGRGPFCPLSPILKSFKRTYDEGEVELKYHDHITKNNREPTN